jgi:Zn-dependent protease
MALGWAGLLKVSTFMESNSFSLPMGLMAEAGVTVNVVLMVLNLLPILPLDGGRIAVSLLPNRMAYSYSRLEPYGFPILLVLVFTNMLGVILNPMVLASIGLIETIFQL